MHIPLITGPTCVGKTKVAVALSELVQGEIMIADRFQIYKGFDLGSGRPTLAEIESGRYHLIGCFDAMNPLTDLTYLSIVAEETSNILSRGNIPIIEGGSKTYISLLLANRREILGESGEFMVFGLYRKEEEVDERILRTLEAGLERCFIGEVKQMIDSGHSHTLPFRQGIGYLDVAAYLARDIGFEDMKTQILHNARRLARSQMEYLRSIQNINWIHLSQAKTSKGVAAEIAEM